MLLIQMRTCCTCFDVTNSDSSLLTALFNYRPTVACSIGKVVIFRSVTVSSFAMLLLARLVSQVVVHCSLLCNILLVQVLFF